jgi:RHS repeat-associated protein
VYYATDHPVTNGVISLYANGQTYSGAAQGYYTFNITAPNYAVTIIPSSKTSVQRWAFSGPYSDIFKVRNVGALLDTFNLTCTAGAGTTCAPTNPTKVTLQSGDSATVTVNYSVGWPGTGGLTFTATSVFGSGPHGPPVAYGQLTVPIYVAAPNVSTAPYNFDDQDLARCASGCFAAGASEGTVPYITLGTARSVGLAYQGDRIVPRPFISVDVQHPTGTPTHPKQFWLQVKVDGVFIPFLNGDTTMHFAYDSTWVRLTGQIDAKSYATGVHPLQIIVTSQYDSAGVTAVTVINTSLVAVNEAASFVARGWTVAGVERLYQQADSSAIVTTRDGSYVYFHHGCDRWGCSSPTATPAGEFSRLVRGTGWTRLFADSTKVVFDNTGRMTQIRDRFGNVANIVYDASGRIWKIQDPTYTTGNNHQAVLAYAAGYGLSTITDPMGRVTRVTVNADSTLRVIKFFGGDSVQFAYTTDGTKRLQSLTDPRGYTGSFSYNAFSGKLDSTTLPAVSINGGAAQAPVTRYAPWQTKSEPTGGTGGTPFTPVRTDSVKATVTDPEGHATSYTSDRWGQPGVITDAVGRRVTVARDANGLELSITNPWGGVDGVSYNADGLVTGYTPAGQAATNITIGVYGQPQEISGANQADQYFFLGSNNGRVDSIRYAGQDSIKTRFTYNTRGQVLTAKDPKGHTSSYHYEATFGNLDSAAAPGPSGPSTIRYMRTRYDKFGRDSAMSGTGVPWSRIVYDSMNRPVQLYDGVYATPTTFSFTHGILTRVVDAKGQVYKDSVNALGWPTRDYAVADTTKYTSVRYNRDGLVIGVTNRRGQAITYSLDASHRPLSWSGQNIVSDSFAYKDSIGGPIVIAWDSVARDSTFANASLVLTKDVTILRGRRFERDYYTNSVGALDSLVVRTDTGTHIHFVPRSAHRNAFTQAVDYVMVGTAEIAFFADAAGRRFTTKFWNTSPQVSQNYNYTSMDLLDSIGVDKPNLNTAFSRGYAYDSTALIAGEFNAACSTAREFAYDGRGRLKTTTYAHRTSFGWSLLDPEWGANCTGSRVVDSTKVFTYDSVDNRTDNGATYTSGNRLFSIAGFSFTYDDDGNQLTKVGNGQNVSYYWTADGLLDSVKAGTTRIAYQYDAQGRLVRKDRNGRPYRYFLWDGGQLLAELDSTAGKRVGEYAYDLGVDHPTAIITGDTSVVKTRYFMQNGLGDVVGIVRDTFVDQTIVYDSWGAQTLVTGMLADTNRLRWQGLVWEGDSTRLYYARSRWYDPTSGRFVSEDPGGFHGLNQYTFAGADPVNHGDPSGFDVVAKCKTWTDSTGVAHLCPVVIDKWWQRCDDVACELAALPIPGDGAFGIIDTFGGGGGGGAPTTPLLCTQTVGGNNITTRTSIAADAAGFINDLVAAGIPVQGEVGPRSSFRTFDQQFSLWGSRQVKLDRSDLPVAQPGSSNHELGYAIDINNYRHMSPLEKAAVDLFAWLHGFSNSVTGDPVHFEHKSAPTAYGARRAAIQEAEAASGSVGACP